VAKVRNILLSIEVRCALRSSKCKHNSSHLIAKGELRLVVKEQGPAGGEAGYCSRCAAAMIAQARACLDETAVLLADAVDGSSLGRGS
jgi:hypothetical protein